MKRVLLYNNLPFHNDLIGFGVDYCNKYKYDVDIYIINDDNEYLNFLKLYFRFNIVDKNFNKDIYDLIIVLTDTDYSYKNDSEKTIAIRHWYINRNDIIKNQIPICNFNNIYNNYNPYYIIPVFNIVPLESKRAIQPIYNINITVIGRFIPDDINYFNFIQNESNYINYNIITKYPKNNFSYNNTKNIKYYINISFTEMYTILANSQYVLITDSNINHNKGYSISSSIMNGLSTGCQLIIPEEMNTTLRLKSAITYNRNKKLNIDSPNYELVYTELNELINKRNLILNNIINK
jgi:hypothetical protein